MIRRSPASEACWRLCRRALVASSSTMHRRRRSDRCSCGIWPSAAASCCAASPAIAAFQPPPMLASAPPATRDVILLNNDTLVPPGWIERLARSGVQRTRHRHRDAVLQRCDGVQLSARGRAPTLSPMRQRLSGSIAWLAAPTRNLVVDVPTAHGFCVYLRRDCLNDVGSVARGPVRPGLWRGE